MEKRLLLATALSILVIAAYSMLTARFAPPPQAPPAPSPEESGPPSPAYQYGAGEEVERLGPLGEGGERPQPPAGVGTVAVDTGVAHLEFTTWGARLMSARLLDYEEERFPLEEARKRLAALTPGSLEEAVLRYRIEVAEERAARKRELEEALLRAADEEERARLSRQLRLARAVELVPPAAALWGRYPLGLACPGAPSLAAQADTALYTFSRQDRVGEAGEEETLLSFEAELPDGTVVRKRFLFREGQYHFTAAVEVVTASGEGVGPVGLRYEPGVGLFDAAGYGRGGSTAAYSPVTALLRFGAPEYEREKEPFEGGKRYQGTPLWTAVRSKYFVGALIPQGEGAEVRVWKRPDGYEAVEVACGRPGDGASRGEAIVYVGPQSRPALASATPTLTEVIFLSRFRLIALIAKGLLFLLHWIERGVGNYGVAILLLALVLKLVFHPLTQRSMKAMAKMQEDMKRVQPHIERLREQHADDPRRLQAETLRVYREHGVNPMAGCRSGCLPLLFQMPVFFALYAGLLNAVELRHAPFVGWIRDLSAPDPYLVLPVLMGVGMFLQQQLTPGQKPQEPQQRMLSSMMPVLFVFIFKNLPSGIVLYWTAFNVFSIIHLGVMRWVGRKAAAAA